MSVGASGSLPSMRADQAGPARLGLEALDVDAARAQVLLEQVDAAQLGSRLDRAVVDTAVPDHLLQQIGRFGVVEACGHSPDDNPAYAALTR